MRLMPFFFAALEDDHKSAGADASSIQAIENRKRDPSPLKGLRMTIKDIGQNASRTECF